MQFGQIPITLNQLFVWAICCNAVVVLHSRSQESEQQVGDNCYDIYNDGGIKYFDLRAERNLN